MWSDCCNFMDQIFNAGDSNLAQLLLNDVVVSEWNSLAIHLSITSLVDEILNDSP